MPSYQPQATTPNNSNWTGVGHLLTNPTPSNSSTPASLIATPYTAATPNSNYVGQSAHPPLNHSQGVIFSVAANRQDIS